MTYKKYSKINARKRIQDEKIKRLEANVESLNKLFEQVAQENRNTRKSVELTILDRIKDTRAYVDRKFADVTDDLNKEPSLKIFPQLNYFYKCSKFIREFFLE